jgi:broad specificity phosphatase PhoE
VAIDLILIRHGESEFNVGLTADLNSKLTANGVVQAERAGDTLKERAVDGFEGIVSPYQRTRETAQIITAVAGLPFSVDEAVREWGGTVTVDGREYPLEAIEDVVVRLRAFLDATRGRKLVIVSHAAPIALLTELAADRAPIIAGRFWEGVENGCFRAIERKR